MAQKTGKQTFEFSKNISVSGYAAIGSFKEGEGPLGILFDNIFDNPVLGQKSWEKAESKLQNKAIEAALKKSGKSIDNIDMIFAGDLLNQCIGSTFGLQDYETPFAGLYGACSTIALSIIMASTAIEAGICNNTAAVTSSHFCSAERQYRFPLEYGCVRTPTSQWTATASGAVIISNGSDKIKIKRASIGKIKDMGIKDANNMGAAMAPVDVKIRPYPINEGMVFFYTQIRYLRGQIIQNRKIRLEKLILL